MITQLRTMYYSIRYPSTSSKRLRWRRIMLYLKSRFLIWRISARKWRNSLKWRRKKPRSIIRGTQEVIVWDLMVMIITRSKTWEITSNTQMQCWYNLFLNYHIHLPIMKLPYQSYIRCSNSQKKNKHKLPMEEKPGTRRKCKKMLKINLKNFSVQCSKTQKKKVKLKDLDWTHKETLVLTAVAWIHPKIQIEIRIEKMKC